MIRIILRTGFRSIPYNPMSARYWAAHAVALFLAFQVTSCTGVPVDVQVKRLQVPPEYAAATSAPVVYWQEVIPGAEPNAAYFVRIDLRSPRVRMLTMPAADPDGEGPAEAALAEPTELTKTYEALASVNCNAFSPVPEPKKGQLFSWRIGMPVDIRGLAVHNGQVRSEPDEYNQLYFWLDKHNRPHITQDTIDADDIQTGINAWWIDLVKGGNVLPRPGGDRHPRTAIGFDAEKQWVLLVVVDGRQPKYSVGMTGYELAVLMKEKGCDRAINLDGGGSSIMIVRNKDGKPEIMNRPSGGKPRPIPIMIGVTLSP